MTYIADGSADIKQRLHLIARDTHFSVGSLRAALRSLGADDITLLKSDSSISGTVAFGGRRYEVEFEPSGVWRSTAYLVYFREQ